jgi:hypothetical protein
MRARLSGTIINTPRMPPANASIVICVVEILGAVSSRKINAGTVKTTPPATDSPAEPIVWTMLFSRIVEPPSF